MNEIIGGRYKLIKRLGSGGMAEVFLAEQAGPRGFARQAVIKRIHGHLAEDPAFIASFENEARLAAQLQHPRFTLDVLERSELGKELQKSHADLGD